MKRKIKRDLREIIHTTLPQIILSAMSHAYESHIKDSRTRAEEDYWIKASRSTANLAGGMKKWMSQLKRKRRKK